MMTVKRYHMGRWYVIDTHWRPASRWSAPAYVSPGASKRVGMRGRVVKHS